MSDNIEVLYYLGIFIFVQSLIVYNIYLFGKKTEFDGGDNEMVLKPDIVPHFFVGLVTFLFSVVASRKLINFLPIELIATALFPSVVTLVNMRMIHKTFYFRSDRIIVFKHADKSTKEFLIKNIRSVKRNKNPRSHIEFSVYYYHEQIDEVHTEYFRGASVTNYKKFKEYFDDKNIPCLEYSRSMFDV